MKLMDWKECEKEYIRKVAVDSRKIEAIIELAEDRKAFIESINISEKTVSFVIEGYYEIIKELLVALLLKRGIKSKNHQCLISFFNKEYSNYGFEINLISQMSYLRNRLNYYGESISIEFYNKNKKEFGKIIKLLKQIMK